MRALVRSASQSKNSQMEFPDLIQNFNYPIPGGEVGQNAALAVGAARDGVAPKPAPATLDCRQAVMFVVTPGGVQWCSTRPVVVATLTFTIN